MHSCPPLPFFRWLMEQSLDSSSEEETIVDERVAIAWFTAVITNWVGRNDVVALLCNDGDVIYRIPQNGNFSVEQGMKLEEIEERLNAPMGLRGEIIFPKLTIEFTVWSSWTRNCHGVISIHREVKIRNVWQIIMMLDYRTVGGCDVFWLKPEKSSLSNVKFLAIVGHILSFGKRDHFSKIVFRPMTVRWSKKQESKNSRTTRTVPNPRIRRDTPSQWIRLRAYRLLTFSWPKYRYAVRRDRSVQSRTVQYGT